MNKTELQQVMDALKLLDSDLLFTNWENGDGEDIGEQLRNAATLCEASLARVVEPVGQVVSSGPSNFPIFQWLSADHSFRVPIGSKLYATPQDAEAKAVQP